jgi:NAD-dependent deacetylase
MWAQFKPEELATPEAFLQNPRRVWEWYALRRERAGEAQPNAGHFALAEIERRVPHFTLITQNVDGLHVRAGSQRVIELHGNIARVKCFDEGTIVEQWEKTDELPPRCPNCGGMLRPDVVWFGEALPDGAFEDAVKAAAQCDLFFSVGTSGVVEPAASLVQVAQRLGATVAIINLDVVTMQSKKLYHIHGKSGEVLPQLVAEAWGT